MYPLSSPFSSSSWCFPHLLTCSFPFWCLPSSFLIYSAFISLKQKKTQPNKEETKGHSGFNYIIYYSKEFNLDIRRKILEEVTFHKGVAHFCIYAFIHRICIWTCISGILTWHIFFHWPNRSVKSAFTFIATKYWDLVTNKP